MNPITHVEIPVTPETKKFYLETFGWNAIEMPDMNYTVIQTSEVDEENMPKNPAAVSGGLLSVEDNGGVNPVLTIEVPDIDAYIEKAESNGAEIVMPKTKVGDMGWSARFKDTAGVVMGLWETIKH